jgi:hypothetical protein
MERNPQDTTSSGVQEQARQQTQQFAQQARQQAGQLANRGSEQVKSQLGNQKHQAAQRMTPIQSALRETGQQLRNQGQGPVAQYADNAADQVERFSRYLRENEVDEILDEGRSFARRRPGLFLGSAATLGFLATRFLKSSSEEQGGSPTGYGSDATSRATVSQGTGEPATALPPGAVEGGSPRVRRSTTTDQPLSDRESERTTELPPRNFEGR